MQQKQSKKVVEKATSGVLDTIFDKMSTEYSIPKQNVASVLMNTAFKMSDNKPQANDAEMVSLLSVAQKLGLNPFTKEIYAFRAKSGAITPVVSVDGWIRQMNEHPNFDGFELIYCEKKDKKGNMKATCYEWIEIKIYLKDKERPVVIREYLDECYNGYNYEKSPWNTHPKRMLRHKTIIQGARIAFNLSGIYDEDEAQRIEAAEQSKIIPEIDEEIIDKTENVGTGETVEKKKAEPPKKQKPVTEEHKEQPGTQEPNPLTSAEQVKKQNKPKFADRFHADTDTEQEPETTPIHTDTGFGSGLLPSDNETTEDDIQDIDEDVVFF